MDANHDRPFYGDGTSAGHKGYSHEARENSEDAADAVTQSLARRHRQMVDAWSKYGAAGATPEDIAADLEFPVHIVRPRAGELRKRGLLYEVGKRMGALGCRVMAYSVVKPTGEAAHG